MKHIPGQNTPRRMTTEEAAALVRQDKRKLIVLSLGFVILVAAFIAATMQANKKQLEERDRMAESMGAGVPESQIYVPEFTKTEVLQAVKDSIESERVLLSEEAILATLQYAQKLTPAQYEEMGIQSLDAEGTQSILENPGEFRHKPLRLTGSIKELRHRKASAESPATFFGTLLSDDGVYAHFVVSDDGKDEELPSDFLRMDGLFVQVYKMEVDRQYVEAPLLVGRRLMPTYQPLVLDEELNTPSIANVKDDGIDEAGLPAISGIPREARWELMAKANQGGDKIDWASAPLVTDEYIGRMLKGDDSLRGQPFRFPVRINNAARTYKAEENPLGRETFMEGWIGDATSKKGNGLVRWFGAFDKPSLHDSENDAHLVTARGFYLKTYVYETGRGDIERAPVFIMESINIHDPEPDKSHTVFMWGMLALTVILIGLISWLLTRDKRQNEALQARLLERRRARRQQAQLSKTE